MATNSNSTQNFVALRKEIRSGQLRPVYFLGGEETFYLDAIQDEINRLMPDDLRAFNFDLYYGSEVRLEQILTVARSYPMMADRRIVVVRDFWSLFERMPGALTEESDEDTGVSPVEPLFTYLNNPNPSTLLVFVDKKSPPANTRLGAAFRVQGKSQVAQFDPIPEGALPEWIIEWAQHTYQRRIEAGAALELASRTGSDLLQLSTELDKLCTFKDSSQTITEQDVRQLVRISREISVFELKNAIIAKNIPMALQVAEQILLTSKTTDVGEVLRINAFFYSMFSNIWQIQRLTQKGLSSKDIQKAIGVKSEYYFNNLVKEARNFKPERIPIIFEALLDTDKSVKGMGRMEARDVLFLLIKRIMT